MPKKLSRRTLLKAGLLTAGATLAACIKVVQETVENNIPKTAADTASTNYMPVVQKVIPSATPTPIHTPTPVTPPTRTPLPPGSQPRVVHVHANNAHNWNNSATNYWDYVNQTAVNNMVDQGLINMTGQNTAANAWRSLMPNYHQGQLVAIKVSFNNTTNDAGSTLIDGIIEPVNAIIRGLNAAGVSSSSIVVYDSSRWLPTRFTSKSLYSGVQFKDSRHSPWSPENDSQRQVVFSKHPDPSKTTPANQRLSNVVVDAHYLINIPIVKGHGSAGLSLALKNHYGSVQKPGDLHYWSSLAAPGFSTLYNPIVEINRNTHIAQKTILTIGDAIFAANDQQSRPTPWALYNNQTPKSLFFSADPVAIDCVMVDFKYMERKALGRYEDKPLTYSYLPLAEAAGLGVYEHPDPNINTFSKIDYQQIEV